MTKFIENLIKMLYNFNYYGVDINSAEKRVK